MPTKEEMAKTIVEMFNSCNNTILSFEEFIAIAQKKRMNQDEVSLRQMHQTYNDLQEKYGGRGLNDTKEQLNDLDEKQLDTLWQKITWANGVIVITHDNSPEEQ